MEGREEALGIVVGERAEHASAEDERVRAGLAGGGG